MVKAHHLREPRLRQLTLSERPQRLARGDRLFARDGLRFHRDQSQYAMELEDFEVVAQLCAKNKKDPGLLPGPSIL